MTPANFYDVLRSSALFPHGLSQAQVNGINALLAAAGGLAVGETAYILATAYHETATTMQPIAEYGKGRGRKYGLPGRNGGQIQAGAVVASGFGFIDLIAGAYMGVGHADYRAFLRNAAASATSMFGPSAPVAGDFPLVDTSSQNSQESQ
ncbi:MAG: hypothetical protein AAAB20_01460 [Rhizobium sp.]|uniref:hypothetical protein n=1 Tax=Rhizobium sp. TaxID=391 RepID=UPI0030EFB465